VVFKTKILIYRKAFVCVMSVMYTHGISEMNLILIIVSLRTFSIKHCYALGRLKVVINSLS